MAVDQKLRLVSDAHARSVRPALTPRFLGVRGGAAPALSAAFGVTRPRSALRRWSLCPGAGFVCLPKHLFYWCKARGPKHPKNGSQEMFWG